MSVSALATDGYKFSMAEAGWPLRIETFYYSHRKGGAQVLPLELEPFLRAFRPEVRQEDIQWMREREYDPGAGTWAALRRWDALQLRALPKGATFYPREPVFSLSGPSALVSWLEPLALQLNFRIQVATLALQDRAALERAVGVATCEEERRIALETLDAVGVPPVAIRVEPDAYRERVRQHAAGLVEAVKDPSRLFEVGLRSATCIDQHLIALEGCRAAGMSRTSHAFGAQRLGMIPVGTMGHEHVQRYGSDAAAFRAMRERRPQRSSYLLDTYDTVRSGIPAAFRMIAREPDRGDSIRYDSGDKVAQYKLAIAEAKRLGIRPVQVLEDAFDLEGTRRFEVFREELGWKMQEQFYGYGGYLVARPAFTPLVRDKVASVYKLSQTGEVPTMKFADDPAKQSLPGRPVLWRRVRGAGPVGIVGQEGEQVPDGYVQLTGNPDPKVPAQPDEEQKVEPSAATRELVALLEKRRAEAIAAAVPDPRR